MVAEWIFMHLAIKNGHPRVPVFFTANRELLSCGSGFFLGLGARSVLLVLFFLVGCFLLFFLGFVLFSSRLGSFSSNRGSSESGRSEYTSDQSGDQFFHGYFPIYELLMTVLRNESVSAGQPLFGDQPAKQHKKYDCLMDLQTVFSQKADENYHPNPVVAKKSFKTG